MNLIEWLPFICTWGLPFDLYLVMQIVTLHRFRGGWLSAALPPLPIMVAVVILTVYAYRADSNLWPIYLILVSIPVAGYLLILLFAERYIRSRAELSSPL